MGKKVRVERKTDIMVSDPNLHVKFRKKAQIAVGKELTLDVQDLDDTHFLVNVLSQNRKVGIFTFLKDGNKIILEKNRVIEKDYYPFEFCIHAMIKYMKRKKYKYILV